MSGASREGCRSMRARRIISCSSMRARCRPYQDACRRLHSSFRNVIGTLMPAALGGQGSRRFVRRSSSARRRSSSAEERSSRRWRPAPGAPSARARAKSSGSGSDGRSASGAGGDARTPSVIGSTSGGATAGSGSGVASDGGGSTGTAPSFPCEAGCSGASERPGAPSRHAEQSTRHSGSAVLAICGTA